nr:MAG TPA: hypothetical protein [Caudoviricetes sp.]
MYTTPTAPLIHIIAGECEGNPIKNALAKHEPGCSEGYPDAYVIATGPYAGCTIVKGSEFDDIREWYPVTTVPTHALELLAAAFANTNLPELQAAALQAVTSHIHPYTKP